MTPAGPQRSKGFGATVLHCPVNACSQRQVSELGTMSAGGGEFGFELAMEEAAISRLSFGLEDACSKLVSNSLAIVKICKNKTPS